MTDTTQDPAAIEQDIRRTQDEMGRTVDRLGDQLTLKNVFNAMLDKADENNVDARYLLDGARRNPVALGLIAAGAIWLVSDKDAKLPTIKGRNSDKTDRSDLLRPDVHHQDYVSHMSSIEMREGEDALSYQRRRDLARANFLMVERNHDEDDHSFRQRLDSMTEKFREKRHAWAESTSQAGAATKQKGQAAAGKAQDLYSANPLVGGILAAAVGAALGSSLPISRQEEEKLGAVGSKAREIAGQQTEQLTAEARKTKDALLEKADQKLQPAMGDRDEAARSGGEHGEHKSDGSFMIGDRDA